MRFSAGMLWQSRTFWAVVMVFLLANSATFVRIEAGASAGFPFPIYRTDPSSFYVFGLLLNLALIWTTAVIAVWLARRRRSDRNS